MNRATLKKTLIFAMSSLPEVEGFEKNNLILTTPIGIIFGKLISNEDVESQNMTCSLISGVCNNVTNDYIQNSSSTDSGVVGNDGYLFLKDVKIKSTSSNQITTLPCLVVFYDQIIGVSIGTFE